MNEPTRSEPEAPAVGSQVQRSVGRLALRGPVMAEVTLHFRADRLHKTCSVCGANLNRRVSRWWLTNCWTDDPRDYRAQQTCHPAETVRPCGVLDRSEPPNVEVSRRDEH
jgi:hypothetical protein